MFSWKVRSCTNCNFKDVLWRGINLINLRDQTVDAEKVNYHKVVFQHKPNKLNGSLESIWLQDVRIQSTVRSRGCSFKALKTCKKWFDIIG